MQTLQHQARRNRTPVLKKLTLAICIAGAAIAPVVHAKENSADKDPRFADGWKEGKLEAIFLLNPYLNNFEIDAEVKGDELVLSGEVDEAIDKDLAEEIAKGIEGISKIDNRIVVVEDREPVKKGEPGKITFAQRVQDITTTTLIKGKLLENPHIAGFAIDVDTYNGHVTLSGEVESGAAKDLSWRLAKNTQGVVDVDNRLTVKSKSEKASEGSVEESDSHS